MFRAKIDASDLQQKINGIADDELRRTIAQAIAKEAVQPELAKEPFRTLPHKKMQFKSAKQRAFVVAGIRSGAINVPYRRTGQIGISEQHQTTQGVDVVVPAPYSDLVRTKGKQADYHQGTWEDTESIAARLEGDIVEVIATAAVMDALSKAGLT